MPGRESCWNFLGVTGDDVSKGDDEREGDDVMESNDVSKGDDEREGDEISSGAEEEGGCSLLGVVRGEGGMGDDVSKGDDEEGDDVSSGAEEGGEAGEREGVVGEELSPIVGSDWVGRDSVVAVLSSKSISFDTREDMVSS